MVRGRTKLIRIDERGQTQVDFGSGWEDCSSEEYDELKAGGYEEICFETISETYMKK